MNPCYLGVTVCVQLALTKITRVKEDGMISFSCSQKFKAFLGFFAVTFHLQTQAGAAPARLPSFPQGNDAGEMANPSFSSAPQPRGPGASRSPNETLLPAGPTGAEEGVTAKDPRFESGAGNVSSQGVLPRGHLLPKRQVSVETTRFAPRLVYLNGINVSDLKDQTLANVNVRIDAQGNIHVTGEHYEVSQDTSFHPLLPTELPRVPKAMTQPLDLPQGIISK